MMKRTPLVCWRREYERLRRGLARIGYLSQGSVVDRSQLKTPRRGYQWTCKLSRKTITVALTQRQFVALRKAIRNRKSLAQTLHRMEALSRRILLASVPDTRRRKPLHPRVLRAN